MASYGDTTHMDVEAIRIWHGVPDHIPDEQIDMFIEVKQQKGIKDFLNVLEENNGYIYSHCA